MTGLRLYDTRRRRVEPFRPLTPGLVRMYVCGPTVYERSHVGHGRSYVVYDVLKRHFGASGLSVLHVQNFTDIEESIAVRAAEAGEPPMVFAERYIDAFLEDMDGLLVARADAYPRVSEHIPEIQAIVQTLLDRKVAYRIECIQDQCNVYFDVSKVPDYGDLVGSSLEDLTAGDASQTGERRHAADFALWKSRDDWGVSWDSPWGRGRPGWHVECAAMAAEYLGTPFDLHGGGLDLVFPHHESERVVAEATWGKGYCGTYVHNGFVTVESRKMSKSKGNFVYVKDLLAKHDAEALRVWFLSAKYREPLPYSPAAVREAAERVARWRLAASRITSTPAAAEADGLAAQFVAALDDDLDTPRALALLDEAAEDGCAAAFREAAVRLGLPSLGR